MNTKPPRFDVKNIIVLNFDEDALDKICFRESLLISHCRNVDNNRECVPFVEKCSEVCPNEQCDDDISDPDDINNELFHPKPTSIQAKQDSQDVNTKKHKRRHQCKKKYCKRKGAKLIKETDVVLSSDRIDDDDFENDVHEDDNSATPDKIRILKLSDCDTSGGFCINIENVGQHLLLYLASQFSVEGCTAGSSILSTSDLNLTLIEERKTEYITRSEDKVEEKCIHIGLDENRYVVIKSHKYGDKVRKICGNLEFENAKYLLFDGAGIILMRYMAITNFKGRVELTTMLINGDIAKVCIQSSGYKKAWVCNSIKRVIEIEKTIIENCGIVQKSLTVLLPDGRMVKHEWEGCDYIIHMNPISNISGNLSSSWENDIELLSRYLDYKSKRKADHKSYMLDAPEAQTILSDYLQYILLTKPSNVLNYTIDYFKCMRPY